MRLNPNFDVVGYCEGLAKSGTEHAHQRAFFGWLNYMQVTGQHPMGRLAFAIANGGKRDAITAAKLKAEGVKPGVPDVCYPVPSWQLVQSKIQYLGLWIEMKKPEKGAPSGAQDEWRIDLKTCGHAVATCWGWQAAVRAFLDYSNGCAVQEEYR